MNFINSQTRFQDATTASVALRRHLWYLSEDLVGLTLLDDRVSSLTKTICVTRMEIENPMKDHSRRGKIENVPGTRLENFFSKRSYGIFDVLKKDGAQEAKQGFLQEHPSIWKDNEQYNDFQARARNLRVINDAADCSVALAEAYNATFTDDEE